MLSIKFLQKDTSKIKKAIKTKGYDADKLIDDVLFLDKKRKMLILETEPLRAERNKLLAGLKAKPSSKMIKKIKDLKEKIGYKEILLSKTDFELNKKILAIPNPPLAEVLIGRSDKENRPFRNVGKIKKFNFPIKDHIQLGEYLNILDISRGVKIGGTRSYILKNELVVLEQVLLRYALDLVKKNGFEVMNVPVLVKEDVLVGAGFFPFSREDIYEVNEKDQFLVGTSEASLVYYYANELLNEEDLPKKFSGITSCFRKEAGTYGKDTKGVIRVHQFNKVEQVILCTQENWQKMFNFILSISEKLLKSLKLPYRLVEICTGDLGAKNAKQIDIEVWFPSQLKYRETHSCSYLTDYQGRRSNIRYVKKDGKKEFVHTLNNTVIATPRILAAILELYQQKDGSVKIPEVLQKYTGFSEIKKK